LLTLTVLMIPATPSALSATEKSSDLATFRFPQETSLLIDSIFSTEINEFVKQGESGKPNYRPPIRPV
jgi:hypothetical protein